MTFLHLWNCINFIFLMMYNKLNNTICSTIVNILVGALNILLNLIVPLIFVSQSYAYYLHHQSYAYIPYPN